MSEKISYNERERGRIDEHKKQLKANEWDILNNVEFAENKIAEKEPKPSRVRELGRKLLDVAAVAKILPKIHHKSIQARESEALWVARKELDAENEKAHMDDQAKNKQLAEVLRQRALELEKMQAELDAKNAQAEAELQIIRKKNWEENQQIWHKEAEAELNERLTTAQQLREAAKRGEEGISREIVQEPDGKQVEIFRLDGYNFQALQHDISYGTDWSGSGGKPQARARAANTLFMHPPFWKEGELNGSAANSTVSADPSFLLAYRKEFTPKNNYISTTYFDTAKYIPGSYTRSNGRGSNEMLAYGFSKIEDRELLADGEGDIVTRGLERGKTVPAEKLLQHSAKTGGYNEVALTRKNPDTGDPKLPDYILVSTTGGEGMKTIAQMHASYFDVPVVIINPYAEKYQKETKDYRKKIEEENAA